MSFIQVVYRIEIFVNSLEEENAGKLQSFLHICVAMCKFTLKHYVANIPETHTASSSVKLEGKKIKKAEKLIYLGSTHIHQWRPQEGSDIKNRKGNHSIY
ncbi:unnamed protein product [Eretmochelys imbricata]